jgi:hypothetical protein
MWKRFGLLSLLLVLPIVVSAFGDSVTLRDGSRFAGVFISGTASNGILFQDQRGTRHRFALRDVQIMEFGGPAYSQQRIQPNEQRMQPYEQPIQPNEQRMRPGPDRYGPLLIPRGTEFPVQTDQTIDSRRANEGDRYMAVVYQDIYDASGGMAIPQGSRAELVIRRIEDPTRTDSAELVLDVDSVTVAGRRYRVSTSDLEATNRDGLGANRRTGQMVGGGAALGALIGAIAGGGKGAAIGAAVGAGAGAGTQVLTRGKDVHVPAETRLRFRLDRDLRLEPAG